MAVGVQQFVQQLVECSLLSAEEVEALLAALPADRRPQDGEQLARELVRQKKLTAWQAQQIYAGKGKSLVLGNYTILDKLGQGGMGMVLKAEHRRMERLVALKVLSPTVVKSPDALRRFHREVKAAARLIHQNIVTAFDADEAGGTHFLVMEYVEGSDLSSLIKKSGSLPVEKALACILQAARVLEFAHEHGVVHRDIKPANLLLDSRGTVKILDMGLARLDSAGAQQDELTGTGQIMGTVDYMAPEQAMNTKNADARADIYSLGVTLWYLLAGKALYDGETVVEKLMAHQSKPIPSLAEGVGVQGSGVGKHQPDAQARGLLGQLDAIFRKMVAKTPAERYQSMAEVIAELERVRGGASGFAPSLSIRPSDDSQLNAFLKGVGGKSLSKPSPSLAMATNRPATEETIDSAISPIESSANLVPHPVAAQAEPTPAATRKSRDNRQLILYGSIGAGVLSLVGIAALLFSLLGGPNESGKPPLKPAPTKAASGSSVTSAIPGTTLPVNPAAAPPSAAQDVDILLLGDGYMGRWNVNAKSAATKLFSGRKVANRGRASNNIPALEGEVQQGKYADVRPWVVIVQIGISDAGKPLPQAAASYRALVASIRKAFPRAKIVLTSVIRDGDKLVLARQLNAEIRSLADDQQVFFVDLEPVFVDNAGIVRAELLVGVSISPLGYERWGEAMQPLVDRLLAAPGATAGSSSSTAPTTPAGNWIELLPLIDPAKDQVKGEWKRSGNDLVGDGQVDHAVIEIPYRPGEEYDFQIEFTRLTGTNDVSLGFSHLGNPCGFCFGQQKVNFGVARVNGQSRFVPKPELALVTNRRYTGLVEVRRDKITGYFDGKLVYELTPGGEKLTRFGSLAQRDDSLLGLTLYQGSAAYHRAAVREVTGRGTLTRQTPMQTTGSSSPQP